MQQNKKRKAINAYLTVKSTKRLSAQFIRVYFTIDQPLIIDPLWVGPHLKLLFPSDVTTEIVFPERDENNKIIWQDGIRRRVRTFSIRGYNALTNELYVDFVVHSSGIASLWAQHAKEGEQIGLLGMGSRTIFTERDLVLVGDTAAMPAICYTIENKPAPQKIIAYIEVYNRQDIIHFEHTHDLEVHWIVRKKGETSHLIDSILTDSFVNIEKILFWGGMEGQLTQQLRRRLKTKYQSLPTDAIQIINYWREGLAEGEFKHRD